MATQATAAKRQPKAKSSVNGKTKYEAATDSTKRVTFVLPQALDQILEFYCQSTGRPKHEVASTALTEYLSPRRKNIFKALRYTTDAASRVLSRPS